MLKDKDVQNLQENNVNNMMRYMVKNWMNNLRRALIQMRILRKGKGLLETFKCKLGYHEWVAVHWSEFKQRPRRAIFSKKGGRRKAQYYEKRYVKYYCMRCGKKRYENNDNKRR